MTQARPVLVVEDDPKIAQLLLDYLRSAGFAASAIADGRLALGQIERPAPSVGAGASCALRCRRR